MVQVLNFSATKPRLDEIDVLQASLTYSDELPEATSGDRGHVIKIHGAEWLAWRKFSHPALVERE